MPGRPAARITDLHLCPDSDGPVPHVGGVIIPTGAPTVFIGDLPAARVSDTVVCVGPPATIAQGSSGVFIAGQPAARMGDATSHGGRIVLGNPTVLIGETGSGAGNSYGGAERASVTPGSRVDREDSPFDTPTEGPADPVKPGSGGGDGSGPPKAPEDPDAAYPIGLAFRRDLPQHLAGPNGFSNRGRLDGTHNLENAKSVLEARRASQVSVLQKGKPGYTVTPTATNGIAELRYQVRSTPSGVIKTDAKTVYDPAVHSDQSMLQSALKAGERAFARYRANPSKTVIDLEQDGIKFRTYIKVDKKTSAAYITNIHPIR